MITAKQTGRIARLYALLLVPCLLGMGLWGCVDDTSAPRMNMEQPVLLSISNRALGAGDKQINTLRILLVAKNFDRTVVCNRFVANPGDPLFIEAVSGFYDVYVVANETHGTTSPYASLDGVRNLAALKSIALPYTTDRDLGNIPMFGLQPDVTITPPTGTPSSANPATVSGPGFTASTNLPVPLTRLACKVNLTIKRSNGTLKAIEFNNLPDAIPLFADTYVTPVTRPVKTVTLTSDATNNDLDKDLYPNQMIISNILLPSWVFTPSTSESEAVQLKATVTEGTGSSAIDRSFTAAIGHDAGVATATKDYTLWRNHDYTLTTFITNQTMSVGASVLIWNDENLAVEDDNPVVPPLVP